MAAPTIGPVDYELMCCLIQRDVGRNDDCHNLLTACQLRCLSDPVIFTNPSGTPVTSDQTPLLSTNTWEIPVEWLIGAGFCTNASNCTGLLCQGHYSYWVVFEAQ
jgi:hypothetical protein